MSIKKVRMLTGNPEMFVGCAKMDTVPIPHVDAQTVVSRCG